MAAAALAVALALPAAAPAKVVTYGGKVSGGGVIALDVALSKKKKPKRVVAFRAAQVPAQCEKSGDLEIWTEFRKLDVKVRDGAFRFTHVQRTHGNRKRITGEFRKRNRAVKGSFTYSNHFPAEPGYPEEDCDAGKRPYSVTRGGEDVVVPPPERAPRR